MVLLQLLKLLLIVKSPKAYYLCLNSFLLGFKETPLVQLPALLWLLLHYLRPIICYKVISTPHSPSRSFRRRHPPPRPLYFLYDLIPPWNETPDNHRPMMITARVQWQQSATVSLLYHRRAFIVSIVKEIEEEQLLLHFRGKCKSPFITQS